MNKNRVKIAVIALVVIVGAVYFAASKKQESEKVEPTPNVLVEEKVITGNRAPSRYVCVGEFCDGSDSGMPQDFTVVKIPLIKDGGNIGCGVGIFFAPHVVEPKTSAVLDATYRLLFDLKAQPEIISDGSRNTVGNYLGLHYNSVGISNGTAKVMLTGSMTGPGHCAEPELRAQINQSAFHFDSVKRIEVYLNGKLFDWCQMSDADVSESRCDVTPRYWIDTK